MDHIELADIIRKKYIGDTVLPWKKYNVICGHLDKLLEYRVGDNRLALLVLYGITMDELDEALLSAHNTFEKKHRGGTLTFIGLDQTCNACPSQWEGILEDGRFVYARYRWGNLGVYTGSSIDNAIGRDGEILYEGSPEGNDAFDGVMDTEEMLAITGIECSDRATEETYHFMRAIMREKNGETEED